VIFIVIKIIKLRNIGTKVGIVHTYLLQYKHGFTMELDKIQKEAKIVFIKHSKQIKKTLYVYQVYLLYNL